MRRLCRNILLASAVLLPLLYSCGKGRVIPPSRMADVYADMFLADQWLKDNPSMRTKADTTYFYDAVFKKHGYTRKDYDASVRHYLEDPQDYAKILKKTSQRLQKKRRQVEKKLQELKAVQDRINSITIPEEGMWQKLSSCRDSLVRGISNNEE